MTTHHTAFSGNASREGAVTMRRIGVSSIQGTTNADLGISIFDMPKEQLEKMAQGSDVAKKEKKD
jgi:hypothetical protein